MLIQLKIHCRFYFYVKSYLQFNNNRLNVVEKQMGRKRNKKT